MRRLFHRSKKDDDLDEEFRSHVQHRADDLERSGMDRAAAERQARIEFGGHERFKEEIREARATAFIDSLVRDVRFSLRVLRKTPGFTIVAVLTLALSIGANAVVFSVLNAFILRPLDVPDVQTLYTLERGNDRMPNQSYPDYVDLRDRNRSFDGLAAYDFALAGLDTGTDPVRTWALMVTANYFDVLRVRPHIGRFFHGSDEHGPDSAPYIVLGYWYWHTHFQDDPNVVGRVVRLNKHAFTIVGVVPRDFHGTLLFFTPDLYVPMVNQEQLQGSNELNTRGRRALFEVIGHLKAGVTPAQAVADLNSIGAYLEKTYPIDDGQMTFSLARPALHGDFLGPVVRAFLVALMLLAGSILLAACANLGSLFAARAADRSREVAMRLALGATRGRVVRQLFTVAVLISLAGGAVGMAGSVLLLQSLSAWQPFSRFPIHVPVTPDVTVYTVALLLTLASGLLFGAVPMRQTLRTDPYQVVKTGTPALVTRRLAFRDVLVVAQIAICAVLVTSSMVAVRGLVRSLHTHFGFEPENAIVVDTDLTMAGYHGDAVPVMQRRMIDALAGIPGVRSVGLADQLPLWAGWNTVSVFTDRTTDLRPANAAAGAITYKVSPEYFRAAGTALLSGRSFTWHDEADKPRVAVVNQEFARRLFGSVTNATGNYFKFRDGTRLQVVGVVEDGKYTSVAETAKPAMFLPFLQSPSSGTWMVVRSYRDPQELAAVLRSTVRHLDAGLPVAIDTWNHELTSGTARFGSRMATMALGVLGVLGAMLSVTGIFGMAAYSVSRRLREIGIRLALGAQWREVLQAALQRAIKLLAIGSALGLLLGVLAGRVLAAVVYQASTRDPLVLGGAVVVMCLIGLVATWIPAQRALSIDPVRLLREE